MNVKVICRHDVAIQAYLKKRCWKTSEKERRDFLLEMDATEPPKMDSLQEPPAYVPMRKQSSGDLQSRLKTRKLLGVGECEDGSVPVSKISQILGTDDHYLIILPAGLRLWQVTSAVVFTTIALLAIFFPVGLFNILFTSQCGQDAVLPIRLFGAAVTCLALLFWSAVKSVSRYIIRWTLLAEVLYLSMQVTVIWFTLWDTHHLSFTSSLVLAVMVMAVVISLYFYCHLAGITIRTLLKGKSLISDFTQDKFD